MMFGIVSQALRHRGIVAVLSVFYVRKMVRTSHEAT